MHVPAWKTLPSLMLSLQKNNFFLSFHSSIFHSKKFNKHPAGKMNRDEQWGAAGQKFEVLSEHTF